MKRYERILWCNVKSEKIKGKTPVFIIMSNQLFFKSKKAVSPIIATVILILIVVGVTAGVWTVVNNYLTNVDLEEDVPEEPIVLVVEDRGQLDRDGDGLIDALNLTVVATTEIIVSSVVVSQSGNVKNNWLIEGGSVSLLPNQEAYFNIYLGSNLFTANSDELETGIKALIRLYSDANEVGASYVYIQQKHLQQKIGIYNDTQYPSSWISNSDAKRLAQYIYENLSNNGIASEFVDGDSLPTWLKENPDGWLVITQGVVPITVFNRTSLDNSPLEQWYDAGGNIIWTADWPFYYYGSKGGSLNYVGKSGERYFFDVSQNMIVTRNELKEDTVYGKYVSGDFSFTSNRAMDFSIIDTQGYSYITYGTGSRTGDPLRIFRDGTDQGHFVIAKMATSTASDIPFRAHLISSILIDIFINGLFPKPKFTVTNVDSLGYQANSVDKVNLFGHLGSLPLPVVGITVRDSNNQVVQVNFTTSGDFTPSSEGMVSIDALNKTEFQPGKTLSISLLLSLGNYNVESTPHTFTVATPEVINVVIYHDTTEATSWISSDGRIQLFTDLTNALDNLSVSYVVADKYFLRDIMENTWNTTIVLTSDVLPVTVYNGSETTLVEKYVEKGGTLVYPGDVPFYYYSENGQRRTVGYNGFRRFLDINGNMYDRSASTVLVTSLGKIITPSLDNHTSSRKLLASVLNNYDYRYYALSQSGNSLGDVELLVGLGKFSTFFQTQLTSATVQSLKVGQVLAEYVYNRTNWDFLDPIIDFLNVTGYDTSFNSYADFLSLAINATIQGAVVVEDAWVNGVQWDYEYKVIVDGIQYLLLGSKEKGASTLTTGSINITIGFTLYNQSGITYFTKFLNLNTISPRNIAVYYDARYPTAWNSVPETLYNSLTTSLDNTTYKYLVVDARLFLRFIETSQNGTVIPINDVLPDTVWNGNDNSLIEQWLENGGHLYYMMDWFAYYVGHADGTRTRIGSNGAIRILDSNLIRALGSISITALTPFKGSWTSTRLIRTQTLNNNGFTYTIYDSTSNPSYTDLVIFNAGKFSNGTNAKGQIISMFHNYLRSSDVPLLVENIIIGLSILY